MYEDNNNLRDLKGIFDYDDFELIWNLGVGSKKEDKLMKLESKIMREESEIKGDYFWVGSKNDQLALKEDVDKSDYVNNTKETIRLPVDLKSTLASLHYYCTHLSIKLLIPLFFSLLQYLDSQLLLKTVYIFYYISLSFNCYI